MIFGNRHARFQKEGLEEVVAFLFLGYVPSLIVLYPSLDLSSLLHPLPSQPGAIFQFFEFPLAATL
jgi:hypothetical protein